MAKARASADQIAFSFDAPQPASAPGELSGLDARVARTVAEALKDAGAVGQDRALIAARMTVLLDDEVSKAMLDAYASPARDGHNISFGRMLALIAVTNRFDLLDRELRAIGAAVLVGDEIYAAEVGHIRTEMARLQQRLKTVERLHPSITRNRRK